MEILVVVAFIVIIGVLVYRKRRMEKEFLKVLGGRWDEDPEMDQLVSDWEESEK